MLEMEKYCFLWLGLHRFAQTKFVPVYESVSIAAEGCGRGPVANVKIIELTGSGEVFSTQERVPMSCFLRLPHSGVYQILISLSSGQCFMGMLTVGDNLHDSPFRKMYDDGAGWL